MNFIEELISTPTSCIADKVKSENALSLKYEPKCEKKSK